MKLKTSLITINSSLTISSKYINHDKGNQMLVIRKGLQKFPKKCINKLPKNFKASRSIHSPLTITCSIGKQVLKWFWNSEHFKMSNREALKKNRDSLTQENVCSSLHVLPTHTEAAKFPSLICQCRDLNYDCDEVCHISKLIVFKRGVAIFKSATSLRSVYQIHRSKALPSFKYFLVEHCTVMIFISIS